MLFTFDAVIELFQQTNARVRLVVMGPELVFNLKSKNPIVATNEKNQKKDKKKNLGRERERFLPVFSFMVLFFFLYGCGLSAPSSLPPPPRG